VKEKIFTWILCLIAFVIVVMIIGGINIAIKEEKELKINCSPTDFYVVGNKGHVTRVYDCGKKVTE